MTLARNAALPADVAALLDAAADRYGISRVYPRAVAWVESGGHQDRVGTRGELGVMQLMPATAAWLEVDPRSLAQNIDGGVRYLAQLVKQYGERSGIASYNAGPGRAGGRPDSEWPESTRNYVRMVVARADYEGNTMGVRRAVVPFVRRQLMAAAMWLTSHWSVRGCFSRTNGVGSDDT